MIPAAPFAAPMAPVPLPLAFKGSTVEYFRIWIVNTCLTLLTLGIFSAWAKVRKKRYFYAHTELSGVPFRYLARPIPILKGRVIGTVLLALWYVGTHFSTSLLVVVVLLGAVLAPWVLVRSAAFNARYSSYRNFTFRFTGTYRSAAVLLVTSGLLFVVSCGLAYPWVVARLRRFMVENLRFGGRNGRFTARGGDLVAPYALVTGAGVVVAVLLVAIGYAGAKTGSTADTLRPIVIVTYVFYGLAFAYLQARVGNRMWRSTSLGPIRFQATYRARDLAWLYLSNAVLSVASLGLLIPWASIRLHRYRVEHLALFHDPLLESLAVFVGDEDPAVRAIGAEVADLFDFDVSL